MSLSNEPPAPNFERNALATEPLRMSDRRLLERCIVWQLLNHLRASGFELLGVFDGEMTTRCDNHVEAMDLLFQRDQVWLRVRKEGQRRGHNIALLPGRGAGILGEPWHAPGDPDGFAACLAQFRDKAPFDR